MGLATGNVMADIFLSYNEKDRPRVRQLAQTLLTAADLIDTTPAA